MATTPPTTGTPPAKPAKPVTVTAVAAFDLSNLPTGRRGGIESKYNFDALDVGQAFGVIGKDKRGMAGAVSNANRKNTRELNGADGQVSKIVDKHFVAVDVDAVRAKTLKGTPLENSTVLVVRDK